MAPGWDLDSIVVAWPAWAGSPANEFGSKLISLVPVRLEGPDVLVIEPVPGYNWLVDSLDRSDIRLRVEACIGQWLERRVIVRFRRLEEASSVSTSRHSSVASRDDRLLDDPLHKLIVERFEARTVRVEADDEPESVES